MEVVEYLVEADSGGRGVIRAIYVQYTVVQKTPKVVGFRPHYLVVYRRQV